MTNIKTAVLTAIGTIGGGIAALFAIHIGKEEFGI